MEKRYSPGKRARCHRINGVSLGGGNCMDAPPPRLATSRQIRKAKELKNELYGDAAKEARAKVSLPKFSWDK